MRLALEAGERVSLLGLDQPAAEVFINLSTGASLPERGDVRLFDRPTAEIVDAADWLATLDRVGIVTDRAALLEMFTVVQNLAVPFSLDVAPLSEDLRRRAIALAEEVGLPETVWDRPAGELPPGARVRAHLARALALGPEFVLLEHPSASARREEVASLASDMGRVLGRRGLAGIVLTMDREFARAFGGRTLALAPATGRVQEDRPGRIGRWW